MIQGCYCYLASRTLVHVFIDNNLRCRCRKRELRRFQNDFNKQGSNPDSNHERR